MSRFARPLLALVHRAGGFTMIELIIVLTIIGILLSIAIGANLAVRQRAAGEASKSQLFQAVPSLEAYFADHGAYTGATVDLLRTQYDQALPAGIGLFNVTADSYCVQAVYKGQAWRKNGPGEPPEKLACP